METILSNVCSTFGRVSQSVEPHADFEPISLLAFVDHVVIMHRSVPANSFHELVEYSKKHPDELNYFSAQNWMALAFVENRAVREKLQGRTDLNLT